MISDNRSIRQLHSGPPAPFYQVFGIQVFIRHGDLNKQVIKPNRTFVLWNDLTIPPHLQVPVITVLMSGKRKKDYAAVFAAILELLSQDGNQPKVKEFMMDFEAAMWQVNSIPIPIPFPLLINFSCTGMQGSFPYGQASGLLLPFDPVLLSEHQANRAGTILSEGQPDSQNLQEIA